MIRVTCERCGDELVRPGGLLFSPPTRAATVCKWHLCQACYWAIYSGVRRYAARQMATTRRQEK